MSDQMVHVYYQPGCPFAAKLRAKLTLSRIPYEAVRFRDDEAAAEQARLHNGGNEVSPTVLVSGQYLTNPTMRQVRRAVARP
jgi:mycoredoxin